MAMRSYINERIQANYRAMESAEPEQVKHIQGQLQELRALEQVLDTARTFK
jgi:septal ring factor EnvC (AmiA/AmiB activator)